MSDTPSDTQSVFWMDVKPNMPDDTAIQVLMERCGCSRERAVTLLGASKQVSRLFAVRPFPNGVIDLE